MKKHAFVFDTKVAFKNYHTSGELFKWIEIIFYFENNLREIFKNVELNTEYTKNIKELQYIVEGERKYSPLEGYIEYMGKVELQNNSESMSNLNDYTAITNMINLPLVNIINYDKFFKCRIYIYSYKCVSKKYNKLL